MKRTAKQIDKMEGKQLLPLAEMSEESYQISGEDINAYESEDSHEEAEEEKHEEKEPSDFAEMQEVKRNDKNKSKRAKLE